MSVTSIEWTDRNWPFARGCQRVSPGCQNCYAERMAARFSDPGLWGHGYAERTADGPRWTGRVDFNADELLAPLRVRKPQRFFPSTIDPFHEAITDEQLDQVFAVMALAPRHTFQILTKRPARMLAYMNRLAGMFGDTVGAFLDSPLAAATRGISRASGDILPGNAPLMWFDNSESRKRQPDLAETVGFPPRNVWLGVSVEDQQRADERIPILLQTPAAVRWVSYEPALQFVDFASYVYAPARCRACGNMNVWYDPNPKDLPTIESPVDLHIDGRRVAREPGSCVLGAPLTGEPGALRCRECLSLDVEELPAIDWIVQGAESGPGARPMEIAWARMVRDQCQTAGVAFFLKQFAVSGRKIPTPELDGRRWTEMPGGAR